MPFGTVKELCFTFLSFFIPAGSGSMATSLLTFILVFCLIEMNRNVAGSKARISFGFAERLADFRRCCIKKNCDLYYCIPVKNTCECTEKRLVH